MDLNELVGVVLEALTHRGIQGAGVLLVNSPITINVTVPAGATLEHFADELHTAPASEQWSNGYAEGYGDGWVDGENDVNENPAEHGLKRVEPRTEDLISESELRAMFENDANVQVGGTVSLDDFFRGLTDEVPMPRSNSDQRLAAELGTYASTVEKEWAEDPHDYAADYIPSNAAAGAAAAGKSWAQKVAESIALSGSGVPALEDHAAKLAASALEDVERVILGDAEIAASHRKVLGVDELPNEHAGSDVILGHAPAPIPNVPDVPGDGYLA